MLAVCFWFVVWRSFVVVCCKMFLFVVSQLWFVGCFVCLLFAVWFSLWFFGVPLYVCSVVF